MLCCVACRVLLRRCTGNNPFYQYTHTGIPSANYTAVSAGTGHTDTSWYKQ
jgi:hypothetical protein